MRCVLPVSRYSPYPALKASPWAALFLSPLLLWGRACRWGDGHFVPSSPHALSTASCALEIQVCCFCSLPLSIRYMQVWVYPSQQMFYNAMRRKGWTPSEDDMAAVVAIHNAGASVREWLGGCVAMQRRAGTLPTELPEHLPSGGQLLAPPLAISLLMLPSLPPLVQ